MKKIMKKALSLALALVMMLSLAPMTAWASDAVSDVLAIDGTVNTVMFDGDEKYVYTWTPEESGDYTFTFLEEDWVCSILGPVSGEYHPFNTPSGVFTHPFEAGIAYEIEILNTSWSADEINFKVEKGAASAGPVNASTDPSAPADITDAMAGVIPAGTTGYFVITGVDVMKTYNVYVDNAAVGPAAYMTQYGVAGFYPNGELQTEMTYNVVSVATEITPLYNGVLFVAVENGNPMDLSVNFSIEAVGGDDTTTSEPILGGDSVGTAVEVTDGSLGFIPVGTTQYYCFTGLDADLEYEIWATNTVAGPAAFMDYITLTAYYPNEEAQGEPVSQVVEACVTATPFYHYMSNTGMVLFAVTNDNLQDLTVEFSAVPVGGEEEPDVPEEEDPIGSYFNPDVIEGTGLFEIDVIPEYSYWFTWTAEAAGVVTFATDLEFAYVGVDSVNEDYWFTSESTDYSVAVQVEAGDKVLLCASHAEATMIPLTITFEKDAVLSTEGEGEEELNYVEDYTEFEIGNNTLYVSDYPYTVYYFAPTTPGAYTLTTSDSVMGIVGYYWVNDEQVNPEVVKEDTIKWNCTDVGQAIYIAVQANTNVANITVAWEELKDTKIPEYVYSVSAEQYVFTGNVADLTYVNTEDKKEDTAVLGEDGYYHLNSADGPILLVSLMDEVLSLGNATGTGKIAIAIYDEEGNVVAIKNYNNVLDTYVANSDKATGLYPLTEKLMEIYKVYGDQQSWYTESGFVGGQLTLGNAADAWMFACMYVPNAEDGTIVVPPVVVAPEQVENNVVKDEVLDEIIENAVADNKPVVVPTTAPEVTMTFDVEDLKDAESVSLNIKVELVEDVKDETVAKNENITSDNFVLKVEFAHEGKLPAKATITIEVPVEYANSTLYYYEITADGALKFICEAPVDANGNAKVSQDHCSDYVLLTEKIVEESPKTGDATNFALWIAVLGLGVVAIAGSVVMKKREF